MQWLRNQNRTWLFLILTFGMSYSLVGIYKLAGGKFEGVGAIILAVMYMCMPMLSVFIVEKWLHREQIASRFWISFKLNKWFLVAWLLMPVLSFATLGMNLFFPGVSYSPEMEGMMQRFGHLLTPEQIDEMKRTMDTLPVHPVWVTLLQGLIAGATINALLGFGEEIGWRGFLLYRFKEMSFMQASLLIGVIWGVWHAPLILLGHNYPEHPQFGVAMMTAWCVLLTPLFLYVTIKAKSVIAAAIMHGTLNATAGIAIMVITGGNDLTVGMTGLAGFVTIAIALLVLFVYDQVISKEKLMTQRIAKFV